MKLTREEALRLHRQMWIDMQNKLGDTAIGCDADDIRRRTRFKTKWCKEHFGDDYEIFNECFLCEYVRERSKFGMECSICPIDWGEGYCPCENNVITWFGSPISEILALPEREAAK